MTAAHGWFQFTVKEVAAMLVKVGLVGTPGSGSMLAVTSNEAAVPSLSWTVPVARTVVKTSGLVGMSTASIHPTGGTVASPRKTITEAPSSGEGACGL